MTFAMQEGIGISKQRGFWLRCFLACEDLSTPKEGYGEEIL
jgi:hypothetical protein